MTRPSTAVLRVGGLSLRHRRGAALSDVSFELPLGVHAVVGANGAGKSSLLAAIGGAVVVGVSGSVTFEGIDLRNRRARRGQVAYQPQRADLPPRATVRECLDYAGWLHRMDGAERRERIDRLTVRFELDSDALVRELSGGTAARVVLAQTWMNDARLVLLDEPVAGVDFEYRQLVRDAVIERGSRSVVLMATHHHDDIAAACDHVLVLDGGRRCFVGPASDFLALGDGDVEAAIVAARRSAAP